jgi:hypothetical protein
VRGVALSVGRGGFVSQLGGATDVLTGKHRQRAQPRHAQIQRGGELLLHQPAAQEAEVVDPARSELGLRRRPPHPSLRRHARTEPQRVTVPQPRGPAAAARARARRVRGGGGRQRSQHDQACLDDGPQPPAPLRVPLAGFLLCSGLGPAPP